MITEILRKVVYQFCHPLLEDITLERCNGTFDRVIDLEILCHASDFQHLAYGRGWTCKFKVFAPVFRQHFVDDNQGADPDAG